MSEDDVLKANDNNTLQGINEKGNSNQKSTEEQISKQINKLINELNDLINDIQNSRQMSQALAQSQMLTQSQVATPSQDTTLDQPIIHGETPTQIEQIIEGQAPTESQTAAQGQGTAQSQAVTPSQTAQATDINATIAQTAQTLSSLNLIKTNLCSLPLDFCEREYIANCVTPLVTAMEFLARTGLDLSTSVSILTTSPIVPRKKGKLKDTIRTIYSMNEEVEEIYDVLKYRFKKITQENNCCGFP